MNKKQQTTTKETLPKVVFLYSGYENLGIEYLSRILIENQFETELFLDPLLFNEPGFLQVPLLKTLFSKKKSLIQAILSRSPILICFSVVTDYFSWALDLAKSLKETSSIPIIFGGVHPTACPEQCLSHPQVDFICRGEGEESLLKLCEALKNGTDYQDIPNLGYKKDNQVMLSPIAPPLEPSRFSSPPHKELFYKKYPFFNDGYTISTSRGCPYKCSYCNNAFYKNLYPKGSYFRKRKPTCVIKELKEAKEKFSPRYIFFLDETFNSNPKWLHTFLHSYRKEINLPFFCYIFPETIRETDLDQLKSSGCFKIQFGLQTLDQNFGKQIFKRSISKEKSAFLIDQCRAKKIFIVCDIILGIPGLPHDTYYELMEFFSKHTPDQIEAFHLKFYPGTPILQNLYKEGYINEEEFQYYQQQKPGRGITQANERSNPFEKHLASFFNWLPFLPRSFIQMMVRHKWVQYFPPLPASLLIILKRFFKKAKYDLNISRTYKKYRYFLFKKID